MMELRGLANLGEGGGGHLESFIATCLICEPKENGFQDAQKMRELTLLGFFSLLPHFLPWGMLQFYFFNYCKRLFVLFETFLVVLNQNATDKQMKIDLTLVLLRFLCHVSWGFLIQFVFGWRWQLMSFELLF